MMMVRCCSCSWLHVCVCARVTCVCVCVCVRACVRISHTLPHTNQTRPSTGRFSAQSSFRALCKGPSGFKRASHAPLSLSLTHTHTSPRSPYTYKTSSLYLVSLMSHHFLPSCPPPSRIPAFRAPRSEPHAAQGDLPTANYIYSDVI